jgi:hypothetical protein
MFFIRDILFSFGFNSAAALASVARMQFAILDRKGFAFIDFPFMETIAAQCFAFVYFLCFWFFEAYYITHPI